MISPETRDQEKVSGETSKIIDSVQHWSELDGLRILEPFPAINTAGCDENQGNPIEEKGKNAFEWFQ